MTEIPEDCPATREADLILEDFDKTLPFVAAKLRAMRDELLGQRAELQENVARVQGMLNAVINEERRTRKMKAEAALAEARAEVERLREEVSSRTDAWQMEHDEVERLRWMLDAVIADHDEEGWNPRDLVLADLARRYEEAQGE